MIISAAFRTVSDTLSHALPSVAAGLCQIYTPIRRALSTVTPLQRTTYLDFVILRYDLYMLMSPPSFLVLWLQCTDASRVRMMPYLGRAVG